MITYSIGDVARCLLVVLMNLMAIIAMDFTDLHLLLQFALVSVEELLLIFALQVLA